jgi:hypothetical protein
MTLTLMQDLLWLFMSPFSAKLIMYSLIHGRYGLLIFVTMIAIIVNVVCFFMGRKIGLDKH